MSTTAFSSQGTQLLVQISSGFVLIPAVVGVNVPKVDPEFDDITNLDSTGGFRERIVVGKNFYTETYTVIWNPANYVHRFLEDAAFDQTVQAFKITSSDGNSGGAQYTFSAYVAFQGQLQSRKAGRAQMTLNGTGAVARIN